MTEGKKIASRMKKDVVMSDLTSPWYLPAFTPGETSSFLRYLLFQLSTKIKKKHSTSDRINTKGYITTVNQAWTDQNSDKCMPKYLAQWDFVKYGLLAMAMSKCNKKG